MKSLKKHLPFILILLLALALRISLLFFRGTLWFDEIFSIHFSTLASWAETWKYWSLETNPPLYTFLLRFYLYFGDSTNPFFTRIPALVFSLFSIAILYVFGKKIFSRSAGIYATTFFALSGIHIVASTETRSYTLFGFLTICSFFLFYELFIKNNKKRLYWFLYILVTTGLLYTHLTAAVIPISQLLALIVIGATKKDWHSWWMSQISAGLIWLPWLVPAFLSKFNSTTTTGWFFDTELFGHANLFSLLTTGFFVNNIGGQFIYTIVMILLVIGIVLLVRNFNLPTTEKKKKDAILLLALWALLPIVFTALLGIFVPKYILFAYPALYLLAGYVLSLYTPNKNALRKIIIGLIIILFPSAFTIATTTVFSWQPFVNYVEKNETKNSITLMAFPETLAWDYFYTGAQPAIGIYLQEDDLPYEERIVRFNWNKQITDDEELTAWIFKQVQDNNADRIFMIQNSISYSWIQEILQENGWIVQNKLRAPGYTDSFLVDMASTQNYSTSQPEAGQPLAETP
jgi:4-amino-4-deoxy-L-arabinose transferase-like glycosyltransferase